MPLDFEDVKQILSAWLASQSKETFVYKESKKNIIHVNGRLLNLENWLLEWKKTHKLNERLDPAIISENILENIADTH